MKIIPVLDLVKGVCVHAVRGERDGYQPVVSSLGNSTDPLQLAEGMWSELSEQNWNTQNRKELYLADLDAIQFCKPDTQLYRDFLDSDWELLIDAGLTDLTTAEATFQSFCVHQEKLSVVAGLETLCGSQCLLALLARFGPKKLIFSLDLHNGEPLGEASRWNHATALGIAEMAISMGVERLILLDLAKIGTGEGLPTLELCQEIRRKSSQLEIIIGGGICTQDDLFAANEAGANAAMVATALHNGQLFET